MQKLLRPADNAARGVPQLLGWVVAFGVDKVGILDARGKTGKLPGQRVGIACAKNEPGVVGAR